MKKFISIFLSTIFFVEGMMFYNHYSYAYHVDQAQSSLNELEQRLDDNAKDPALGASVLGIFALEDGLGDVRLKQLAKKIVNSTEHAVENADDITRTQKLKTALDEIFTLQELEVDLISNALEKVEDESISEKIGHSYEKAVDLKEKVEVANLEVQEALENNQETIHINIVTSKDKDHGNSHDDEDEHDKDTPGWSTSERIQQKKEEDAHQREINRERILIIEEGKAAKKSQELKNRINKAQQKRVARDRQNI